MVDKNGKLFGKINLIDFLIILVLVLAVAFVALRVTGVVGGSEQKDPVPVRISFFGSEVPDYVVNSLKEGDKVYDFSEDIILGTVESWEIDDPLGYVVDDFGDVHGVAKEGEKSLTLTITGEAVMGDYGATIEGELYGVGHTTLLYAGVAKLWVKVSAIEPIE